MRIGGFTVICLFLIISASLWAQMTPNAPVKNFRYPRFAENGYTEWVLQGAQGIYDSEEQIRVKSMALRVYSGDERMTRELTLDSPQATIRIQENRAFSDAAIRIVGANFTISGTGWEWVGATREIVVAADAVVEFSQSIEGGFPPQNAVEGARRTVIRSEHLVLQTTEKEHRFEFSGSVRAVSGDMDLQSKLLIALADVPAGAASGLAVDPGTLDSVRRIIAMDAVEIVQGGRTVRAGEAHFETREGRVTLTQGPEIELAGAYLSGAVMRSQSGEMVIEGSPDAGRAQTILLDTGGLGLQGISALSEQTIILADKITMQGLEGGNRFFFDTQVEVMSGAVQLKAAKMMIEAEAADAAPAASAGAAESGAIKVGVVRRLVAEGGVRIEQDGQVATGEQVVFYPLEERCVLTGQPQVTNGEAIVSGHRMELQPQLAIVSSGGEGKVKVELPAMPDLGYQTFTPSLGRKDAAADESAAAAEAEPTVVQSRQLRMLDEPEQTLFRFSDAVEIHGTNLHATCARLDVSAREPRGAAAAGALGQRLEVERIEAQDSVVIRQSGRTATAVRAFILPQEGKMVLEDQAVVEDPQGRVSGYRMTLLQGQRRAIVEGGDAPGQERARITLPALPGSAAE